MLANSQSGLTPKADTTTLNQLAAASRHGCSYQQLNGHRPPRPLAPRLAHLPLGDRIVRVPLAGPTRPARHVLAALSTTAWGTAAPVALLVTGALSGVGRRIVRQSPSVSGVPARIGE